MKNNNQHIVIMVSINTLLEGSVRSSASWVKPSSSSSLAKNTQKKKILGLTCNFIMFICPIICIICKLDIAILLEFIVPIELHGWVEAEEVYFI